MNLLKFAQKIIESFSTFAKKHMNLSCHDKFQLKIGLSPYQIQFSVTIFLFSQPNLLSPQHFSPKDGASSSNYSQLSTLMMNLFATKIPSFTSVVLLAQSHFPPNSSKHFTSSAALDIGAVAITTSIV
jgi:hypothetical protein